MIKTAYGPRAARGLPPSAAALLVLSGCDAGGSPTYSLFGAHFPASLLCAGAGLLGAVAFRFVLVAVGLEAFMPARLLVYAAFAASVAIWTWLSLFGAG